MSVRDCLIRAGEAGELSKAETVELVAMHDEMAAEAGRLGLTGGAVNQAVAERMLATISAEKALKKRRELLQVQAGDRIRALWMDYKQNGGDIGKFAIQLLENFGEAPFKSVVEVKKTVVGLARAQLHDILNSFERDWLTGATPQRALLDDVVREAHGMATGSPRAAAMAQAWREVSDTLRQRFNAAGGAIGKLDDWGLPHGHNAAAVWNAGFQQWRDTIAPRLDRAAMVDPLTKLPFSDTGWDRMLRRVWERIVTNGDVDLKPSRGGGGHGSLASQHADHRFLKFKDADAWLDYDKAFGKGNAFAAMMEHIDGMGRDIALMEVLGPNPAGTIRWLQQVIKFERAQMTVSPLVGAVTSPVRTARRYFPGFAVDHLANVYDNISGALAAPVSETAAKIMSGVRNFNAATTLSGAVLSSLADVNTSIWARWFNDINMNAIGSTIRALPNGGRDEALRAGLAIERTLTVLQSEASHLGALEGPQWAAWLADRTLTLSGLTPLTRASREGYGIDFLTRVAQFADQSFTELPFRLRHTFERYGFDQALWETVRQTPKHADLMIRPNDVVANGMPYAREAGERLLGMILMETEFAVPSQVNRVQAVMTGGMRRGTFGGEAMRTMMQLKSYTGNLMFLNIMRIAQVSSMASSRWGGAAYASGFVLGATLLGGMVVLLKDIAKGKDPREVDNPAFLAEALAQGGGLGIIGDFVRAETNRVGSGIHETLAGPTVGKASGAIALLTETPAKEALTGADHNFARVSRRFISSNTPILPFYLRTAYERGILDRYEQMLDPEANQRFKEMQKRDRNERGQDWFWQPGDFAPERAPDLPAALGDWRP